MPKLTLKPLPLDHPLYSEPQLTFRKSIGLRSMLSKKSGVEADEDRREEDQTASHQGLEQGAK